MRPFYWANTFTCFFIILKSRRTRKALTSSWVPVERGVTRDAAPCEYVRLLFRTYTLLLLSIVGKGIRTTETLLGLVVPIFRSIASYTCTVREVRSGGRANASSACLLINKCIRAPLTLFSGRIPKVRLFAFNASAVVLVRHI